MDLLEDEDEPQGQMIREQNGRSSVIARLMQNPATNDREIFDQVKKNLQQISIAINCLFFAAICITLTSLYLLFKK